MAINWEMGVSDPLKGVNAGLASLGQALQYQQQQERLAANDKRANSLADLQLQQGQMSLAKSNRDLTNQNDLQTLIRSQQGRTTPVTSQVPNPAYTGNADPGLAQSQADNAGEWTPSAVAVMRQSYGLPDAGQAPQDVPATINQTTQQPMSERDKALETQNFLKERGMFDHLKELATATSLTDKIDEKQRVQMAHVQSYGTMAYMQAINSGADEETASKAAAQAAIQQAKALGLPTDGMENAQYKGNISFMKAPDGGFMYTSLDPGTGKLEVKHIAPPKPEHGDTVEQLTAKAIKGDASAQAILDAMQKRELEKARASRQIITNNPMPSKMSVGMNQLTPEQSEALSTAIAENRLAPYKVNSKNQQILADTALKNPGIDLNNIEANMGLARNVKVQDKAGNAAILPDMIKDVSESGKKLDYSNFAPAGKASQWWDKLTNDPDYINYSAKRNDIIMRIGGVMRENGMTDQAQKLEEDSAPRSMSPRAFDAWASAQMTVLKPIMEKYTQQAQGKGTPGVRQVQTPRGIKSAKDPLGIL